MVDRKIDIDVITNGPSVLAKGKKSMQRMRIFVIYFGGKVSYSIKEITVLKNGIKGIEFRFELLAV